MPLLDQNLPSKWPNHGNTIYGHIHMAKTAGTEINGELAAKYERVCGHKGYSYDAYQHNMRAGMWKEKNPSKQLTETLQKDLTNKMVSRSHNRGRVHFDVMKETGYEDCDWISHEYRFSIWPELATQLAPFEMEVHVPCREPVDWLMSMLNFRIQFGRNVSFSCEPSASIEKEVQNCLMGMERFDDNYLLELPSNMHLKCFNPIPIDPYLDYMEGILQPKRFPTSYVHRETNLKRNKTAECIHSNATLKNEVAKYLTENVPVFRFCKECMGSKDDLLV
jgi:hypothetical protein